MPDHGDYHAFTSTSGGTGGGGGCACSTLAWIAGIIVFLWLVGSIFG